GGKKLSRTFVTRTLLGNAGITYKYLGLRLFAHPWDRGIDCRRGPGDDMAAFINDPCITRLWGAGCESLGGGGTKGNEDADPSAALRKMGELSKWMRGKAMTLLDEEAKGGRPERRQGRCDFNLTLVNRMEGSMMKKDLKPDPLFAMGKCS
ncbi:unnamed protein product, partial [Discosporangium mesarthrocarpum]